MRLSFGFSWGTKPLGQPWHSLAMMLVGVGFAVATVYAYLDTARFTEAAVKTEGVVTGFRSHNGNHYPVVRFYDNEANKHFVYSNAGGSAPGYEIGERVPVLYPRSNPAAAKIYDFLNLWAPVMVLCIFAVAFPLASVLMWLFVK